MAALRQDEQRAAAAIVGVSDVRFLGHPDGRVQATLELRRDISRVIRQVRPERVITQSPERNWDFIFASHPDHLAVGEAAVCAVYPDARNPFAHPELLESEGLEPWTVNELWIMGPGKPSNAIAVETTATVERKIAALMCHKSQLPDADAIAERIRIGAAAARARRRGSRPGARPRCSGSPASPEPRWGALTPGSCSSTSITRVPARSRRRSATRAPTSRSCASTRATPSPTPTRPAPWPDSWSWAARWASTTTCPGSSRSARCSAPPSRPDGRCSASASAPNSWRRRWAPPSWRDRSPSAAWARSTSPPEAFVDPVFGPAPTPLPCVHWHGDTFTLPDGAVRLAGNEAYENQAFRVGTRAYGLQFHVEVTGSLVAHWSPHLPPGVFVRAEDVAHVSRAGDGLVRRFVALAARRRVSVSAAGVRKLALALPEATEEPHHDLTSFRVRAKIFATMPPEGGRLHVFLPDDEVASYCAEFPVAVEELRWGKKLSGCRVDPAPRRPCPGAGNARRVVAAQGAEEPEPAGVT